MDRDAGKENRGETVKRECGVRSTEYGLRIIVILVMLILTSFMGNILYAEVKGEGEKKIELEKTEIFGVLERPATIFPVRWKDPDGPEEKTYTLRRSFKREILEFVDMDSIDKMKNPKLGILNSKQ